MRCALAVGGGESDRVSACGERRGVRRAGDDGVARARGPAQGVTGRVTSSGSLPDPVKVMLSPARKVEPSAGLVMVAVGGELIEGALTVTLMEVL